MPPKETYKQNQSAPPIASDGHVHARWFQRATNPDPCMSGPEVDRQIKRLWCEGIPVGRKGVDCGSWRLYPPQDVLIAERDGYIKTILLRPPDDELTTDHLVECPDCGEYENKTDSETSVQCRWCGRAEIR